MDQAAQWTVYETGFHSSTTYENPFWDVDVSVRFTAPDGQQRAVEAYWNGGDNWRVRFSPTQVGEWTWQTECSDPGNSGLHNQRGMLHCTAYSGSSTLFTHGPLGVSASGHHIQHADGTPFFWLADTAWNGVLLSKPQDWARYLGLRKKQGFTAIQFVTTQWRASTQGDAQGQLAYEGTDRIRLNPAFFDRADQKIAMINAYGMIAAPVVLWTLTEIDPGQTLTQEAAARLARYEVARWGANQVVWLLGGDGRYEQNNLIDKFKHIGRAAFGDDHDRLVTMHPCGQSWPNEHFRDEPWFDFAGYQSGHGDSDEHVRWLVQGPPATQWNVQPVMPVINLEPNYEGHPAYQSRQHFTDYHVRRASYWSLLVSPPAGVTFGNNEIWNWREDEGPSENHANIGVVQPWPEGLETPGIASMTILKDFFTQLRWTELRPAPELVLNQADDPNQFMAAAWTVDGSQIVVYLPVGGTLELAQAGQAARWFDPRNGTWQEAVSGPSFTAPDAQDWLLVVEG